MQSVPDDPVIKCMEASGYPYPIPKEHIICHECGTEMWGDEVYYDNDGNFYCEQCFEDYISDMPLAEIAYKLGVTKSTVSDYFEGLKGD